MTKRILLITLDYMKLLMDADCLIKLTKAGLKEIVVLKCDVFIPGPVKREVVAVLGRVQRATDKVAKFDANVARPVAGGCRQLCQGEQQGT